MSILIPRSTQILVKREGTYINVDENQDWILIDDYEGERHDIKHNNLLGEFNLNGLLRAPRGDVEIINTMEIDANGIVKEL